MATKLTRDITRETTVKRDKKEVLLTVTGTQEISLKLKGTRGTKPVSINVGDLYDYLTNQEYVPKEGTKTNPMISLYDLRSSFLTEDVPYDVIVDLERKTLRLIELKKNEK